MCQKIHKKSQKFLSTANKIALDHQLSNSKLHMCPNIWAGGWGNHPVFVRTMRMLMMMLMMIGLSPVMAGGKKVGGDTLF